MGAYVLNKAIEIATRAHTGHSERYPLLYYKEYKVG